MRKISGQLVSAKPISLSRFAKLMSRFASVENGSSTTVSLYLQRTAEILNHLVQFHDQNKSLRQSTVENKRNPDGEIAKNLAKEVKEDDNAIYPKDPDGDDAKLEKKKNKNKKRKKSDGVDSQEEKRTKRVEAFDS